MRVPKARSQIDAEGDEQEEKESHSADLLLNSKTPTIMVGVFEFLFTNFLFQCLNYMRT